LCYRCYDGEVNFVSLAPFFKLFLQISYSMFYPGACTQLNFAASYIELTCKVHLYVLYECCMLICICSLQEKEDALHEIVVAMLSESVFMCLMWVCLNPMKEQGQFL
jgi:hypothetical protein